MKRDCCIRLAALSRVPGSLRAKTGLLVPEWNRYFLSVRRHQKRPAEVHIYDVQP
jgi:hypothetical protein